MSVEATYLYGGDGCTQDYTAAATIASGEILALDDGRAGVAKVAMVSGDVASVYTGGFFDIYAASGTTFTAGDPVWWDTSASAAVDTQGASDDLYLGIAMATKGAGVYAVRIALNIPQYNALARGTFACWVPTVAYNSGSTEYELLAAANNVNGAIGLHFFGVISTVMGGDSQDQQIITLYDSDDNALATLTPSDAAADAAGDIVVGTNSAAAASTGAALIIIPAGKGAYVKTTQACAGTGAAGAMKVHLVLKPLT